MIFNMDEFIRYTLITGMEFRDECLKRNCSSVEEIMEIADELSYTPTKSEINELIKKLDIEED